MSTRSLRHALHASGSRARRATVAAHLLPAVAVAVAGLAAAAWMARAGWNGLPLAVVLAWIVGGIALGAGWYAARRGRLAWRPHGVAHRLEVIGASRRGAVAALLDPPVAGTSTALHDAAAASAAQHVSQDGATALAPDAALWAYRARLGLAGVMLALFGLLAARPLDGSAAMVWRPATAWSALTAPVRLTTTTPAVGRGARAILHVRAWGQRRAVLRTRAPGEPWQEREVVLDAAGEGTVTTAPLDADLIAVVRAGGRASAEVRVTVRLPAFLGAFAVTAEYPAYLMRDPETLPIEGDTLLVPAGTRLLVHGRTTAPLATAVLQGGGDVPLQVTGDGFSGAFAPVRDGAWTLVLALADGAPLDGVAPTLAVRVVPDRAPTVEIPIPGRDTVAPPSMQLPIVVTLQDDHALRAVALDVRHRGAEGGRRITLVLPEGTVGQALVTTAIDLDTLLLLPGDTLWYTAVGTDNAPRAGVGRSRTYAVRIPTASEQRDARREATSEAATGLDSLAAQARDAQRQTDDLARTRPRPESDPTSGAGGDPLAAEGARRAEQAVEAQEAIEAQAEALREQVDALREAAEASETPDSALADQLAEIRDLLDRAMSPELRETLEAVREASEELDAERTRSALRDLAEEQAKMRQALEQARELFERAALETELAALAEAAAELAEAQDAVAEQMAGDPAAAAEAEAALAQEAAELAEALEAAATQAGGETTQEGLRDISDRARAAGEQMRQAAAAAQQGQAQQAQSSAEAAGEMLEPLEEQIRTERGEMQEAMRAEVAEALDRLLAETSRVLDRQLAVAEAYRRGANTGSLRTEQGLLEEGATRLFQQALSAAAKNALVSPRIASSLAAARTGMRGAIEATSTATPNLGVASEQSGNAVDALAVAAHALLRSREQLDGSASGSGMQEAMEQMQQMAGQQGQLSERGQGMMQDGQGGMEQMLQLAMQQRAIAQQLERMQAGGEMPGAGALGREALEISRSLEAGRLTPETTERQQRLFRRMLDAGRSLEGEERDERKERQSETAEGTTRLPPALEARLRRGADEVPMPGWEELQQLRPDDRRRVLEYFRRLTVGGG